MLIRPYSFRLLQRFPLATQSSLHLSERLWHLHCQRTSAAIPCLPPKDVNGRTLCEGVKQAAVFNLQTVCLVFWSRTIPAYITSLQPGDWIKSGHGVCQCPGATIVPSQSHRALSGGSSCSLSGVRWNYSKPWKKNPLFVKALFIVTPHSFFFCPEQIQDKKAHEVIWCSISKVEM